MAGSRLDVRTADGVADAYLARPEGDGPQPPVLFLIDAFGLRPRIEEMADRIAARGYTVLAPNVFYRAGRAPVLAMPDLTDPEGRGEFMAQVRPLMDTLTPERISADGAAYLDCLAELAPGPAGLTGYCMGGRLGWSLAAAAPERVAALACFHTGGLVGEGPDSPHLAAPRIGAELYFGFADQDPSMSATQIASLEEALDTAGARYHAEVYAGAGHGYTMSDTPVFDEAACERHFEALFALLERNLNGQDGDGAAAR